jgi:hypothetical protein
MKPKKKPSILCRRGHRKTGKNAIIRYRDGKKIVECRKCANASLQARREARRRNEEIISNVLGEFLDVCEENPDAMKKMMNKDFARWDKKINAKLLKGEE